MNYCCCFVAILLIYLAGVVCGAPPDPSHGVADQATSATHQPRNLQAAGVDGGCHFYVSADPDADPASPATVGSGILFPVQSDENDDDGVVITGLGFRVDRSAVASSENGQLPYAVYVLSVDGYYASTERNAARPWEVDADAEGAFDYRGLQNMTMWWTKVADGNITLDDLKPYFAAGGEVGSDATFYELPAGSFRVSVPPNGGARSFYIQTSPTMEGYPVQLGPTGLLYADPPNGTTVNVEVNMFAPYPGPGHHSPRMLVGEGFEGNFLPDWKSSYTPNSQSTFITISKPAPSALLSILAPTTAPSHGPHLTQHATTDLNGGMLEGGLLLSLSMKCKEGDGLEDLSEDSINAITGAVRKSAEEVAARSNPYISNIEADLIAAYCVVGGSHRHLFGITDQTVAQGNVMEFSVLITGYYDPPKQLPGEAAPSTEVPDLGRMTENHINRDPGGFARELNDRAGETSRLAEVEASDVNAQSVVILEDEPLPDRFTKMPTPTPGVTQALSQENGDDKGSNVVGIVVGASCAVAVVILLLGVYLFHANDGPDLDKAQGEMLATCAMESGIPGNELAELGSLPSDDGSTPPTSEDQKDIGRQTQTTAVGSLSKGEPRRSLSTCEQEPSERGSDEEEGEQPPTVTEEVEGTDPREVAQTRFEGRLMSKLSSSAGGSSVDQAIHTSEASLGGSNLEERYGSDNLEVREESMDPRDSAQSRFEDRLMQKMSSNAEDRGASQDVGALPASRGSSMSAMRYGVSTDNIADEEHDVSFSRFERRLRRKLSSNPRGRGKVSPASRGNDSKPAERDGLPSDNVGTEEGSKEPNDMAFDRFERRLRRMDA